MTPDLSQYTFSAPNERVTCFTEIIRAHTPQIHGPFSIVDIGCGTGQQTLQLSKIFPSAKIQAYDISPQNIKQACDLIEGKSESARVHFICADYLLSSPQSAAIIVSDSCLHLIACEDAILYTKLKNDLAPNGLVILTIPYDCFYNQIIFLLRRFFKKIHSNTLEHIVLLFARLFFWDKYNVAFFRERLPYLYFLPIRLDNARFRAAIRAHGLNVIHEQTENCVLGKPRQHLLVLNHGYE